MHGICLMEKIIWGTNAEKLGRMCHVRETLNKFPRSSEEQTVFL